MNEDCVALIMCEKCVYRLRFLKQKESGIIGRYLFKRYFLFNYIFIVPWQFQTYLKYNRSFCVLPCGPLEYVHVGSCLFALAYDIMKRATCAFAYVQCTCINKTVCAFVNKSVCECVNGSVACRYSKYHLMCVDVIRGLLIGNVNRANMCVRINGACCLYICKGGLLVVHIHAYWAYWLYMFKWGLLRVHV